MRPDRRTALRRLAALACLAALPPTLLAAGCGYQSSSGAHLTLPDGVKTLHLDTVKDPTLDVQLAPNLRSLFRDEITQRDQFAWSSKGSADGIVDLDVVRLSTGTRVTDSRGKTLKFNATITLRCRIVKRVDRQLAWDSGEITVTESYLQGQEDDAKALVLELAVRRLVDRMAQNY